MLALSTTGTLGMVKLSAWLAIAVGVVLAAAQLLRNYDNWQNWPTWMIDELAAVVLVAAGLLALRRRTTRLLPVGWAFACGLYAAGVVSRWNALGPATAEAYGAEQRLMAAVAGLVGVSLVGLALVLFSRKPT